MIPIFITKRNELQKLYYADMTNTGVLYHSQIHSFRFPLHPSTYIASKGLVVQLLSKGHQLGGGVQLVQVLLRHRQHTAGAAGRVIDSLDHIIAGQNIVVIVEQDINHQPDHFSGGVVLPGVLVVRLGKPADDLLKDVAHLQVGNHIRVQVGLGSGELLDDNIENSLIGHGGDLSVKLELFQDVLNVLREAVQVSACVASIWYDPGCGRHSADDPHAGRWSRWYFVRPSRAMIF